MLGEMKIILLLLVLMPATYCHSQISTEEKKFNGLVESSTQKEYNLTLSPSVSLIKPFYEKGQKKIEFNELGEVVFESKSKIINKIRNTLDKKKYVYDEKNRLIEIIEYYGKIRTYAYNNSTNELLKIETKVDGSLTSFFYRELDANNNVIKTSSGSFSAGGDFRQNCQIEYYKKGLESSIICFDSENNLVSKKTITYKKKEKLKDVTLYYSNNGYSKVINTYSEGLLIENRREIYKEGKNIYDYSTVKKYENKNLLTNITLDSLGNIKNKITNIYKNSILSSKTDYQSDGVFNHSSYYDQNADLIKLKPSHIKKEEYFYKYDDKKNWIVRCTKSNNHIVKADVRLIKYRNMSNLQMISKKEALCFCDSKYLERLKNTQKKLASISTEIRQGD